MINGLGHPVDCKKHVRKARTRFTYVECKNDLLKGKFFGQIHSATPQDDTVKSFCLAHWFTRRMLLFRYTIYAICTTGPY